MMILTSFSNYMMHLHISVTLFMTAWRGAEDELEDYDQFLGHLNLSI
jgi:hypothetical protein